MGKKPTYVVHDGFPMPAGFPVEAFGSALQYRAQPGDIIVSTYPKCGTTWTQHIVWLLLHEGTPLDPDQKLTEVFPHLEEVGRAAVEALPSPRLIKTHLPFEMTPFHAAARYIYVTRNPFDCAVSFYHHTRGFPKHYDFADGTFSDFFDCFVQGAVDFGDYFDNLLSWHAHEGDDNVLFLTYENMKRNTRDTVARIGAFLGVDVARDPALVERTLQHSSFASMRKDQDRWTSRRPDGMPSFVRKGVVGDWMSEFTRDQTRRLLEKFSERAEGTTLPALWPEILNAAREFSLG